MKITMGIIIIKRFIIKCFYPICFGFHSHLEKYINKVVCLTFSYLKRWAYGMN